jgi:hypothetical protein
MADANTAGTLRPFFGFKGPPLHSGNDGLLRPHKSPGMSKRQSVFQPQPVVASERVHTRCCIR